MALSDGDKKEIAELVAETMIAMQLKDRPGADEILPLIQQPNIRISPGPQRSRYSTALLADKDGVVQRRLRIRTADVRTVLLAAYNDEAGDAINTGETLT